MKSTAERRAYRLVPETCPKVDAALSVAADVIKEQTGDLREALVDTIHDLIEAEDRIKELESEIVDLKAELDELAHS